MSAKEHQREAERTPVRVAVLTISDTRTEATDTAGAALRDILAAAGHVIAAHRILRDEPDLIRAEVCRLIESREVDAVVTTGGTGIGARDGTYEALDGLLEKRLDGFGELFRALSYASIGSAAFLSRAVAGIYRGAVVAAVPGSEDAARLAAEKLLAPELRHMVSVARKGIGG